MGSKDKKVVKNELLALQNIIFNTDENKLMVSQQFLNTMTLRYVGKRLKLVNTNLSNMSSTKSPIKYFNYCEIIDSNLDELCKLEPYYNFKKPVPSEFKKTLLDKREHSIASMFNRAWKGILNKVSTTNGIPDDTGPFELLLNEMMLFKDRLTPVNLSAIDMYEKSIRDKDKKIEDVSDESTDDEPMMNTEDFNELEFEQIS